MQPLTELFRSTIETFPSILLEHRVKLADITSEKEVLGLTDEEILEKDYVFPRKYELETLRYWRKMGLLPFFDQSTHAAHIRLINFATINKCHVGGFGIGAFA